MEITEFEKKRAANLIWNGARDYTISPGFRVYDEEGKADLYWNSIVGVIHHHYNWKLLLTFYNTFKETVNQGLYESLFWIALENAAYEKEKDERPVLPYLRGEYARRMLAHSTPGLEISRADWILRGHLHHALGDDSGLPDLVDRKMLKAIELSPDLTTEQVIDAIEKALKEYIGYYESSGRERKVPKILLPVLAIRRRKKGEAANLGPVRRMAFGFGEHVSEYGSEVLDQSHLSVSFAKYTAQTDEGMREYITNFFGKPLYDANKMRKLQKDFCYGNHTDVRLHFTRGDYTDEMLESGYAGKMRQKALAQAKTNAAAYAAHASQNRVQIDRLTSRIRNSVLMHLDTEVIKSTTGQLAADRIWRGIYLNDDLVFDKELRGDQGSITVDILLDASTSQVHRQAIVAAQGYMIAEALTRCGIPVRVYSFCSLNGYTIVNLFRDYQEVKKNREIFRYFTTGANRDGLAVRLAAGMLKKNDAEHRILITLSDCKPNDVVKVNTSPGVYKDYAAQLGVEDTAAEVHAARMQGISVMCVFTGNDDSLPAVREIYGTSFARIRELELFADTVGSMLQTQISLL